MEVEIIVHERHSLGCLAFSLPCRLPARQGGSGRGRDWPFDALRPLPPPRALATVRAKVCIARVTRGTTPIRNQPEGGITSMRISPAPFHRHLSHRAALAILIACGTLTACSPSEDIRSALPPVPEDTPWPTLVPRSQIESPDDEAIAQSEAETDALLARAAALRARAASMSAQ
ncbi:hypothetical protein [Celeribacter sp.]|uniref:hypothetical protein n=1 Tax=Celeribacter sp. TaxID=1890673 RepID=UPI003A90898D